MPGSMPATSQLDWLSSTTAMIVLFWSRATRDLLKSFGWGIAALHRYMQRRSCHFLAARPIASLDASQKRVGRLGGMGTITEATRRSLETAALSRGTESSRREVPRFRHRARSRELARPLQGLELSCP